MRFNAQQSLRKSVEQAGCQPLNKRETSGTWSFRLQPSQIQLFIFHKFTGL
jgi:hypothetical protein